MTGACEIVLVRHGETEWSSSGRHTSFTDVPLTPRGHEQAAELTPRLSRWEFVLVLSSPRSRALDTCAFGGLVDLAEMTEDLAEWNYGDYEGRTTAEIRRAIPHWTIFSHGAPGGETAAEVGARADRVLVRAASVAERGPVALFSHGHFLRVLGARWVGLAPIDGRFLGLDTATISVLGTEREQRVIRLWNS